MFWDGGGIWNAQFAYSIYARLKLGSDPATVSAKIRQVRSRYYNVEEEEAHS